MRIAPGRFPCVWVEGGALAQVEALRDFVFQASGMAQLASGRTGAWTGWEREPFELKELLSKLTSLLALVLIDPFDKREALELISVARGQAVPVVLIAREGAIEESEWSGVDAVLLAKDFSLEGQSKLLDQFRELMSQTFQSRLCLKGLGDLSRGKRDTFKLS